ncbi:hypothetical protein F5146DRAFT_1005798 [Armillaria mellea]|nr:hypothetical protein F5146DRAFT_1005798 [Armillaria mellea]
MYQRSSERSSAAWDVPQEHRNQNERHKDKDEYEYASSKRIRYVEFGGSQSVGGSERERSKLRRATEITELSAASNTEDAYNQDQSHLHLQSEQEVEEVSSLSMPSIGHECFPFMRPGCLDSLVRYGESLEDTEKAEWLSEGVLRGNGDVSLDVRLRDTRVEQKVHLVAGGVNQDVGGKQIYPQPRGWVTAQRDLEGLKVAQRETDDLWALTCSVSDKKRQITVTEEKERKADR